MKTETAPAALDALAEDYEIVRELGRGGTAVVYLARERRTGDEVAIKLVRAQFAGDDEATARLAREARFVAQLHHPNVVSVRDVLDLGDAGVALVMTPVPGRTLRQVLRDEGALEPGRAMRLLRDVAAALGAAHELGIVHRDVKPENVFVDADDRAVLADFGIARSMSPDALQLTMHGVAIGTPAYMAPEQIDGLDLDARADLYSLGLLGWEMLTGRRPFAGEALYSVLYHQKHVQVDDPRVLRADVPAELLTALAGAVEKERDARWTDAAAFLAALDGASEPRDWPAAVGTGGATVRVERAAFGVPEGSVVAIDWRAEAEALPLATGWRAPSRRRVALGSGIGALAALAFVVSAVRIHSREAADDAQRIVSEGQVALAGSDRPAPVTIAAAPVDSLKAPVSDSIPSRPAAPRETPAATPALVAPPSPPSAAPKGAPAGVTVGGRHSCLLSADGRAYCWGDNDRGQLGTVGNARLSSPLSPAGNDRFVALASGMSHSCGITSDGDAYCWGDNDAGQLGDGTLASHTSPAPVAGNGRFHAIVAGGAFTCALAVNGAAWCWGSDANGELGDRGTAAQPAPVRVANDRRFTAISAGWTFACALDASARAWCWGSNASGELGDSSTVSTRAPVRVDGAHTFTAIAAGSAHACAIASDGSAWCWGSNSNGQLGDGTTHGSNVPVHVRAAARFTTISVGAVHSCALTDSGDAWCWGSDLYGQLGNDGNSDSAVPVRVAGGHTFTTIRAFGSHNCGLTSAGETFCWGYNLDGQLGDGTRTHRSRPVYVQRPATQ